MNRIIAGKERKRDDFFLTLPQLELFFYKKFFYYNI